MQCIDHYPVYSVLHSCCDAQKKLTTNAVLSHVPLSLAVLSTEISPAMCILAFDRFCAKAPTFCYCIVYVHSNYKMVWNINKFSFHKNIVNFQRVLWNWSQPFCTMTVYLKICRVWAFYIKWFEDTGCIWAMYKLSTFPSFLVSQAL
jgi:hypothetical protein